MKRTFIIPFFLFVACFAVAQPQPCDPENPRMTSTCAEACIICDIDGFTGRHSGTEDGEAPPLFAGDCTQQVHNMQWIAFIAGSTDLKVSLSVSNCDMGLGLEFGLYKGIDCDNFVRISNCFGGFNSIPPGRSGTIENTEPLVIGQYYFIVMDGAREDNCDWTFQVVEGSTSLGDLTETATIEGDFQACINTPLNFTTDSIEGATLFEWELDGVMIGNINEASVELNFDTPGNYDLCLTPKNPCNESTRVCETIQVPPIPVTDIDDEFCSEDCYEVAGQQICNSGDYSFVLVSSIGCDSVVNASLVKLETPMTALDILICDGDMIDIGNNSYGDTGMFREVVKNNIGCDSIIDLDLFVIDCNIQGESIPEHVRCYGEQSGALDFSILNGQAPFTYEWSYLGDNTIRGNDVIDDIDDVITIPDLESGTYLITIEDGFGNIEILISEIFEPDPLELQIEATDRNGFSLSCHDSEDAELVSTTSGGTPPYKYLWSEGGTTSELMNIGLGTYDLTVTDEQGCTIVTSYETTSPEPLFMDAEDSNPTCDGFDTGVISVLSSTGGVRPYQFSIDGSNYISDRVFTGLSAGNYDLTLQDANGCIVTTTHELVAPEIPIVDLGSDLEVCLGDSIYLEAIVNNITISNLSWSSQDMLSCPTCLESYISPTNNQQVSLSITSMDDCTESDAIQISVVKNRNFYAPTILNVGATGDDKYFTIFSSKEVENYNLRIYDRWGNLMYEGLEIEGNDGAEGWNARYNNRPVKSGVYVWSADITFLDGEIINYSGSVTVIN